MTDRLGRLLLVTLEAARLGGASFVIPELETSDVQLNGPPTKVQRDPFHQRLLLREDRVAGVARFPVAWATPDPSDAVLRQETVLELASDEKSERFLVHTGDGAHVVIGHAGRTSPWPPPADSTRCRSGR